MKTNFKNLIFLVVLILSATFISCEKEDPTQDVVIKDLTCKVESTNVTTNGGNDGTIKITVLTGNGNYFYEINPNITNLTGNFVGLSAGVYNVKVIDAENKQFTKVVALTEPTITPVAPTINTLSSINVTSTTATLNGKVNANGFNTTLVKFEYGLNTSCNKSIPLSNVTGNTLTDVSTNLTGLTPNTSYYYRLVATNSGGTTISNVMTFTTSIVYVAPTVSNVDTSNVKSTSAILLGRVNANGSITTVKFEYGLNTSYGESITLSNISGNTLTDVTTTITNLVPNKLYHYKLVTTNNGGTTTSGDMTFTTKSLKIGDAYQGGIVAYILQSGDTGYSSTIQHGLIADTTDLTSSKWSNSRKPVNVNTGVEIGDGYQNTLNIIKSLDSGDCAAKVCQNLGSDWFLPSREELKKLQAVKSILNMTGSYYWSSSQVDDLIAIKIDFSNSGQVNENKLYPNSVRAIRKF